MEMEYDFSELPNKPFTVESEKSKFFEALSAAKGVADYLSIGIVDEVYNMYSAGLNVYEAEQKDNPYLRLGNGHFEVMSINSPVDLELAALPDSEQIYAQIGAIHTELIKELVKVSTQTGYQLSEVSERIFRLGARVRIDTFFEPDIYYPRHLGEGEIVDIGGFSANEPDILSEDFLNY